MTQSEEILAILIDRGHRGLNSFDSIRQRILQMPFVIKSLKNEGYVISSIDQPDGSTTYVLQHVPPQLKDAVKAITQPVETSPEPTMFEVKSTDEKKHTIEELMRKIIRLREEYRKAPTLTDQKIIVARASAIKNAIAKIDPAHPSLSGGRTLAR